MWIYYRRESKSKARNLIHKIVRCRVYIARDCYRLLLVQPLYKSMLPNALMAAVAWVLHNNY